MKEILKISYDNTADEIETAYKAFQNRFLLKKKILYSVIYLIVIVLAADMIIRDQSNIAGYIAGGLALGILVFNWIQPYIIRKKMMHSLAQLGTDEKYSVSLFDDRIEIETLIAEDPQTETVAITSSGVYTVEEGSDAAKEIEQHPELVKDETKPPEKTVYRLTETELSLYERGELLLIFVNRAYFHTIPERCLNKEELSAFKGYFEDKGMAL